MTDADRHRGPLPPVFFLAGLLVAFVLHFKLPLATLITPPWTWLGLLPLILGLAITVVAARTFSRAGTAIRPFHESSVLVVSGMYRFTRNPMYLGMALVLFAVSIFLGSLTPFAIPPLFVLTIQMRFIRHEETMLQERFGEQYRVFCSRVRRWL